MSVAPTDYDGVLPVGDELYEQALEDQRLGRSRTLRLVPQEGSDEGVEVSVVSVGQEQLHAAMADALVRVIPILLRTTVRGDQLLADIFNGALPWAGYLPHPDFAMMIGQAASMFRAHKVRTPDFEQFLTEWQHTAEIYADPEAHQALSRPLQFDGPVLQRPGEES